MLGQSPFTSVGDGDRDTGGRFTPGNKAAKGNPHAKRVALLRTAMLEAVSAEDIGGIVRQLVTLAKEGNVQAAREVLDRCLGRAEAMDLLERLEALEELLEGAAKSGRL